MSHDKAIAHGKEHRQPYRKSRAFDPACREGRCPYCQGNKLHPARTRDLRARDQEIAALVDRLADLITQS
jgi:hypothetical protein